MTLYCDHQSKVICLSFFDLTSFSADTTILCLSIFVFVFVIAFLRIMSVPKDNIENLEKWVAQSVPYTLTLSSEEDKSSSPYKKTFTFTLQLGKVDLEKIILWFKNGSGEV